MRRALWLGLMFIAAAGCETYTIAVPYTPTAIDRLPEGIAIAVYQFADKRGEGEATRLGGIYGGYRNLIHKIYGTEPAAVTVSRAIARGLEARGFQVLDLTRGSFRPRIDRPDARVAITGDVLEFWTESQWRLKALSAVSLEVYAVPTGEKVWSQKYAVQESTWETTGKNLQDFLALQLSQMVQRVVVDQDLLTHVRATATVPVVAPVVTTPTVTPPPPAASPSRATADRLQELDVLRQQRLISEEEYQAARKRILEGL